MQIDYTSQQTLRRTLPPKCGPLFPGLMGSVVPGGGQAGRMVCLYLCGGIEPQSFTGSLGVPKVSLSLLGFRDSVQ